MDFTIFITLFHIIGVALGVGGATVSDLLFFRAIADRRISRDEFAMLHTMGYVLWAGLIILFLSGVGFVTTQLLLTGSSTYLVSAWFWAKMTIVFTLFCNALVMHLKVFPFMTEHLDQPLTYSVVKDKLILLSMTGVISIVSWYSAMTLGVTRGLDFSYLFIVNAYLLLLLVSLLVAYILFTASVFGPRSVPKTTTKPKRSSRSRTGRYVAAWGGSLLLGAIIISSAWYAVKPLLSTPVVEPTGVVHVVCITEAAPWFTPTVLNIEPGDTVTWAHCHQPDDYQDWTPEPVVAHKPWRERLVPTAWAHGTVSVEERADYHTVVTHTHPILAISGPEIFSSDYQPIGHLEDNKGYSFIFTKRGVYEYICPTHPYMRGAIVVGAKSELDLTWPPSSEGEVSLPVPIEAGTGEVVVSTQFAAVAGQAHPGLLTVVDANTWQVSEYVYDDHFNNPYLMAKSSSNDSLFLTHWHSDELSIIDATTKAVTNTVSVGNAPAGVVVHPTRDLVYVALNNTSSVVVYDQAGNYLRDIIVPFGAHALALSPDGGRLAVVSSLVGEVAVIDVQSEIIEFSVEAPDLPLGVVFTPDNRYLLVSLSLNDTVQVIDLINQSVVSRISVGEAPGLMLLTPERDSVLVANTGSDSVSVIDVATWQVTATITTAAGPVGLAIGEKANGGYFTYVTHRYARSLGVIDLATNTLAGLVPLGVSAWGGAGVVVLPGASNSEDLPVRSAVELSWQ